MTKTTFYLVLLIGFLLCGCGLKNPPQVYLGPELGILSQDIDSIRALFSDTIIAHCTLVEKGPNYSIYCNSLFKIKLQVGNSPFHWIRVESYSWYANSIPTEGNFKLVKIDNYSDNQYSFKECDPSKSRVFLGE
jgi:hypothetical protein